MRGNNQFLLDTNVIIATLAGKTPLADTVREDPFIAVSVITEIELLSFKHLSAHEEKSVRSFLKDIDIIYINHDIKEKTIALRKKYNLKTPDTIIAATAICSGYVLVTDDKILLDLKEASPVSSRIFANIAGR